MMVRTDLALEAREMIDEKRSRKMEDTGKLPEGMTVETRDGDNILVTRIVISTDDAAKTIGKKKGTYVTIELKNVELNTLEIHREVACAVRDEVGRYLNKIYRKMPSVMIAGLGNRFVTPDALGPKVVENIVVSRHVRVNERLSSEVDQRLGEVCAFAPGVLGVTGVETGEIIQGIVDKIKPDILLAVDALASRKTSRINTTVQISDTGIVPGSGIGNRRMELSEETLGIPVVAIGVPTVVDAMTMAKDLIENATGQALDEQFAEGISRTCGADTIVTPKNIDIAIERMAQAISNGLNMAVHKGFDFNDVSDYLM